MPLPTCECVKGLPIGEQLAAIYCATYTLAAGDVDGPYLLKSANLSDVDGAQESRNNLGVNRSDTVILVDQKPSGTNGGTSVAGWNSRTLTVERLDTDNVCVLNADNIRFQLSPGIWTIEWTASIGYDNGRCGSRLFDFTNNTEVSQGRSVFVNAGEQNDTSGVTSVTIAVPTEFIIQTYHQNGVVDEGFGSAKPLGVGEEVYTMVKAIRLQD